MDASEHPADLYRRGCEEPGRVFDTPRALLEDARLDREQKLDILQRWAHDLRELSTATAENMPASDETGRQSEGGDAAVLGEVLACIERLHERG